jgi:hypothetical protein
MSTSDKRKSWNVPSAAEVAATEDEMHEHRRGPISWVRKLRVRKSLGVDKSNVRPPIIQRTPVPPVAKATSAPPAPPTLPPPPKLPPPPPPPMSEKRQPQGGEARQAEEALSSPPSRDVETSSPSIVSRDTTTAPRRQIRIGDKARKRRTGSSSTSQARFSTTVERRLTQRDGFGRCSCGQTFRGPSDVIKASYAAHQCGVDRGIDREDWMFDR